MVEDILTPTQKIPVQKIYIAYYGRPADPAGLSYWANRLNLEGEGLEGTEGGLEGSEGLETIIEAFATSPESVALYGAETGEAETTDLVTRIYQQLFNREPDAEGLAFYSDRITSGEFTAATAMLDILNGARDTDLQVVDNKLAVAQDFTNQVTDQDLAYSGEAAAGVARFLLDQVSASTSVQELDTVIQLAVKVADLASTQAELVAELIPTDGEVGDLLDNLPPEADAEDLLTIIKAVVTSALDDPSVLSSLIEAGGGSFASTLEALSNVSSLAEILNEAKEGGAMALEALLNGIGSGIFPILPPAPTDTTAPTLESSTPADNAEAVAPGANIELTFDSAIVLGSGNITLVNDDDNSANLVIDVTADNGQLSINSDGDGTVLTIDPNADLVQGNAYHLEIESGAITDVAGNDYAGISDAETLNFATAADTSPPDTTAPMLLSHTPTDGADAVAAGANIVLTFDSAIELGSGTITLVNAADTSDNRTIDVAADNGQLSLSSDGTMLTINPSADLAPDSAYHLEIAATAITDVAGNPYAGISDADALNFATAADTSPPDTTAPTLESSTPADNADAVAPGANLALTFDSAIVLGSGTITLVNAANPDDNRVINAEAHNNQLSINTSGNSRVLTIDPSMNLAGETDYHLEIESGAITDEAGNPYGGIAAGDRETLNFATADITAPSVTRVSVPAAGTYKLGDTLDFTVQFSEAVNLTAADSSGGIASTLPLNLDSKTVAATYVSGSGSDRLTYRYTVAEGDLDRDGLSVGPALTLNGDRLTDASGNAASLTLTSVDTSGVRVDGVAPLLSSSSPTDDADAVAPDSNISLTFDSAIALGSGTITLVNDTNSSDNRVIDVETDRDQLSINASDNSRVLTIDPSMNLAGETDYHLEIESGAITDEAGNPYGGIAAGDRETLNFATADITAPTVTRVSVPAAGNYKLGDTLDFTVQFSEAVNLTAADSSGGIASTLPLGLDSKTASATYESGNGSDRLTYRYTVAEGDLDRDGLSVGPALTLNGDRLTDASGNAASLTLTSVDTSGVRVDGVAPLLSSSSPTDDADAVAPDSNISLTFDSAIALGSGTITLVNDTNSSDNRVIDVETDRDQLSINASDNSRVLTIDPSMNLAGETDYHLEIESGAITDEAGNPYGGIAAGDRETLNFATADITAPSVTRVSVPAAGTYKLGDTLDFTVQFSEAVNLTAADSSGGIASTLPLNLDSKTVAATYVSGSGSDRLTYRYTVAEGDLDRDGLSVGPALTLNGDRLTDASGNAASLTLTSVDTSGVRVDGVAPLLSSSSPTDDADAVAPDSNISLTFDSAIALGSGTITLVNDTNSSDSRTIDVTAHNSQLSINASDNSRVLTIDPSMNLAGETDYHLEIESGAITDEAGNPYGGIAAGDRETLNFATADITAPTVTRVSVPAAGTYKLGDTLDFTVQFSEAVNLTAADSSGGIASTLPLNLDSKTVAATYVSGSGSDRLTYRYTVAEGDLDRDGLSVGPALTLNGDRLTDASGNAASLTLTSVDTSGVRVDGVAPLLSSSSPTDDADAVAPDSNISLTFDSAIALGSGTITLVNDTNSSDNRTIDVETDRDQLSINASDNSRVLTIDPSMNLAGETDYHLEIESGAITDEAGNPYGGIAAGDRETLNFATADITAPTVTRVSVPAAGTYKLGDTLDFTVQFSEAVNLTAADSSGGIASTLPLNLDSKTVAATYVSGSGSDRLTYRYTVAEGDLDRDGLSVGPALTLNGDRLTDASGNAASLTLTSVDTSGVRVDGVAPLLSSSSPTDDADAVAPDSNISLTFDSAIALGSGTITLVNDTNSSDNRVIDVETDRDQLSINASDNSRVLTIDPSMNLAGETDYHLEIESGAITDEAGNPYGGIAAGDRETLNFATADITAPSVTGVSVPAAGTYKLGDTLDFTVQFSEAVNLTAADSSGGIASTLPLSLDSKTVAATYVSGSGSDRLTYRYTVAEGDLDRDGLSVGPALTLNGDRLTDASGNAASLTLTSVDTSGVRVDGVAPLLSSSSPTDDADAVAPDSNISLTFDSAIALGSGTITLVNDTNSSDNRVIDVETDRDQLSINASDNSRVLTIDPSMNLAGETDYHLEIESGAITDEAGNPYGGIAAGDRETLNFATADITAPSVTGVSVPAAGTYKLGDPLEFTVQFSEAVSLTAADSSGGIASTLPLGLDSKTVAATYVSGSGSDRLTYRYTVAEGDLDRDGLSVGPALTLNGDRLTDASGNAASLTLTSVDTSGVRVDGVAPLLSSSSPTDDADAVAPDSNISLTFDSAIALGSGTITLVNDTNSSDNRVIDVETDRDQLSINASDNSRVLTIDPSMNLAGETDYHLEIESGAITDEAGNPYGGIAAGDRETLNFATADITAPSVTRVSVPAAGTYKLGDTLDFTVQFSEAVNLTAADSSGGIASTLPLNLDSKTVAATYVSGSGSDRLTYRYTVAEGDLDRDGLSVGPALTLNGDRLTDASGNAASLTLTSVDTSGVRVDGVAPLLSSSSPTDDADAVAPDSNISLTFDSAIALGSGTITLVNDTNSSDNRVIDVETDRDQLSINASDNSRVLTIDPGMNLAGETDYHLEIESGAITDEAGNPYGGIAAGDRETLNFATADITAPTVTRVSVPAAGTYKLGDSLDFTVQFSEAVNLTAADSSGGIASTLPLNLDSKTVAATYVSGSGSDRLTYRYTVAEGDLDRDGLSVGPALTLNGDRLTDASGNAASLTLTSVDTSGVRVDGVAPLLSSSSPTDDADAVAPDSNISLTFDSAIALGSGTITLVNDTNSSDNRTIDVETDRDQLSINASDNSRVLTIDPSMNLAGETDYHLEIESGAITDEAGNPYGGIAAGDRETLNFATADITAPSVTRVSVPAAGTYKLGDTLDFTVQFSEAVSLTAADSSGGIASTLPLSLDSKTVAATYVSGSDSDRLTYRYTVAAGDLDRDGLSVGPALTLNGDRLTDASGNAASLTLTSVDTSGVRVDGVAPLLSSSSPTDDADAVAPDSNISLTFDSAIALGSGTITLVNDTNSSDNRVIDVETDRDQLSINASDNSRVLTIDPSMNLAGETDYHLEIESGAITDEAGNPYGGIAAGDRETLNFATADITAPTVTRVSVPAAGTYKLGDPLDFTVQFSEAVNLTAADSSGGIASTLPLNLDSKTVAATYVSGSGSDRLTYRYTVAEGDLDRDGLSVGPALTLNGDRLTDASGNAASLTLTSVDTSGVRVDGVAPLLSSSSPTDGADAVAPDSNISLTFDSAIALGSGTITLVNDTNSSDNRVIDVETDRDQLSINASDNSRVLTIDPGMNLAGETDYHLEIESGAITDEAGNPYGGIAAGDRETLNFATADITAPTVTRVSVPEAGNYKLGDTLDFIVQFSEAVSLTAADSSGGIASTLPLSLDSKTVAATYVSGSDSDRLTYRYTVAAGDLDRDGLSVGPALTLNGDRLTDASGNAASLTLTSVDTSGVRVDGVAPLLSSSSPTDDADAVAPDSNISLTFDSAIALGSGTITLVNDTNSSDNRVIDVETDRDQLSINASDNSRVLTIDPSMNLAGETDYHLEIESGAITDEAGNPYGGIAAGDRETLNFATADITAPTVTRVSVPAAGTYKLGDPLDFTVQFSEAVNLTAADSSGGIASTLPLNLDSKTVAATYVSGSGSDRLTYRYTVAEGDLDRDGLSVGPALTLNGDRLTDASGNAASLTLTSVDTSGVRVDGVAPLLSSSSPTDGADAVAPDSNISLTFDSAIALGSGTITLVNDTNSSDNRVIDVETDRDQLSINASDNSRVLTIDPSMNLAGETGYHLEIESGAITDEAGNPYGGIAAGDRETLNFATADITAPSVTGVSVPAAGTYKLGDTLDFTVQFSEAVNLTAADSSGGIASTLPLNLDSKTVAATYVSGNGSDRLTYRYTVAEGDLDRDGLSVGPALTLNGDRLTDASGNAASLTLTSVDTSGVRVDGVAPLLSSSSPTDDADAVAPDSNISLTFDSAIALGSGTITLVNDTNSSDNRVIDVETDRDQLSINASDNSRVLTIDPSMNLAGETDYHLEIESGAITDEAGNPYGGIAAGDRETLNFATADITAPSVTRVSVPAAGTYKLGDPLDFTVQFSEAVNLTAADSSGGIASTLPLNLDSKTVAATYVSGSGSDRLTYRYTVAAGDLDRDGLSVGPALTLNGDRLTDASGNAASLTLTSVDTSGVRVDGVAPLLSSSSPTDDADAVAPDSNISLTFDSAIALGSGTITLVNDTNSSDNRVIDVETDRDQLSINASDNSRVLTIDPSMNLAGETDYHLEIESGAITDEAGNPYGGIAAGDRETLNFATADITAPSVTRVSVPAAGTYKLGDTLDFTVQFSEAVSLTAADSSGGIASTLSLSLGSNTGGASKSVAATYVSSSDSDRLTYRYTVAEGDLDRDGLSVGPALTLNGDRLTDASGNAASLTLTSVDTSGVRVDGVAPLLSSSSPDDDADAVAPDSNISLTFDSAIALGSGTITLVNDDDNTDNRVINVEAHNNQLSINSSGNSRVLTIDPSMNLAGETDYHLEIESGAITDEAGNPYGGIAAGDRETLNFATADITAPTVTGVSVPAAGTYKLGDTLEFTVQFSEAVNLTAADSSGGIASTLPLNLDSKTVAATYVSGSGSDRLTYRYTVAEGDLDRDGLSVGPALTLNGDRLTDASGNAASLTLTSVDTSGVRVDGVAPLLSSSSPTDGADAVAPDSNISLTFDSAIALGSGTITLVNDTNSSDNRVIDVETDRDQLSINASDNSRVLTIDPSMNLAGETGYHLEIESGAITDEAGNPYGGIAAGDRETLNFATADITAPSVTGVSVPAAGTYKLGDTLDFTVQFSEAVNLTAADSSGGIASTLPLNLDSKTVAATYVSGNGSDRLTYRYTVAEGDLDRDGLSVGPALTLNGDRLTDASGNAASLTLTSVDTSGVRVDGVAPLLSSSSPTDDADAVAPDSNISLTFDSAIALGSGTITLVNDTNSSDNRVIDVETDRDQLSINASDNSRVLTIDPSMNLAGETGYHLEIESGAITDEAGNPYGGIAAGDRETLNFATADITAPSVTGVSVPAAGTYKLGDTLDFTVQFSEAVNLTAADSSGGIASTLPLNLDSKTVAATYVSGSGSDRLTYRYTVAEGDLDRDGLSVGPALTLNGDRLTDASGNAASLTLTSVDTSGVRVDGVAPLLSSSSPTDDADAVAPDSNISLTFDSAIALGSGTITLVNDTNSSDSRTIDVETDRDQLSINASDNSRVLTIDPSMNLAGETDYHLEIESGAITDEAGNPYGGIAAGDRETLNFATADITAPSVTGVSVPAAGTYKLGDTLDFTVQFSEAVNLTAADSSGGIASTLPLNLDSKTVAATYVSGSGSDRLTYRYTVAEGDLDRDGLSVGPALTLNGDRLTDASGNAASLTLTSVDTSGVRVDGVAPLLSSSSPTDDADAVAPDSNISLTFDSAIALGSGTITLVNDTNSSDSRTIDVETDRDQLSINASDNSRVLTIDPSMNLAGETDYHLEIESGAITDEAGNPYGGIAAGDRETLNFATADITAPSVTRVSVPAAGTYKLGDPLDFTVQFSEAVNLTAADSSGGIASTLPLNLDSKTVAATYVSGSGSDRLTYRYTVAEGDLDRDGLSVGPALTLNGDRLTDASGNAASLTLTSVDTSGVRVDGVAPLLSSSSPTDDADAVAPDSNISLTFDSAIALGSGTITLVNDTNSSDNRVIDVETDRDQLSINASDNSRVLTIDPSMNLAGETGYHLEIESGAITDEAGNPYGGIAAGDRETLNFATADITAPSVTGVSVPAAGTYKLGDTLDFTVQFSEAVNLTAADSSGGIASTLPLNLDSKTVAATYVSGSGSDRLTYRYTVAEGDLDRDGLSVGPALTLNGDRLTDASGNAASLTLTSVDTSGVRVDGVAPLLSSSSPTDDADAVAPDSNISLTFDSAIALGSGTITLVNDTNSSDNRTIDVETDRDQLSINASDNSRVLTIDPSMNLAGETDYHLEIESGAITDEAGNPYGGIAAGDRETLNFATADITAPTVTGVSVPAAGTYKLGDTLDFTVQFSEAVNLTAADSSGGIASTLPLNLDSKTVAATYVSGSGSDRLTYRYTVAEGDLDRDGLSVGPALTLNGDRLTDASGNAASLTLTSVDTSGVRVDGVAPLLSSSSPTDDADAVAPDSNISLTFDSAIALGSGTITLVNDTNSSDNRVIDVETDRDQLSINASDNSRVLTIDPSMNLAGETATTWRSRAGPSPMRPATPTGVLRRGTGRPSTSPPPISPRRA